jgi:hypothetical protein
VAALFASGLHFQRHLALLAPASGFQVNLSVLREPKF